MSEPVPQPPKPPPSASDEDIVELRAVAHLAGHATKQDLDRLRDHVDTRFEEVLLAQREANGSIGKMWTSLYGDEGRGIEGLVAEHREVRGLVLDSRAVIRVGKWLLPILLALTPLMAMWGARVGSGP